MKKTILFLTICYIAISNIYAQESNIDISIEKSNVFKEKKDSYINTIFKDNDNKLFILRTFENEKAFLVDLFSENFEKLNAYEHKLKKRHRIAGGFFDDEKIGFVEYFENKRAKKVEAFLYTSPKDKLNFSSKKIFEINSDTYPSFFENLFASSKIDKNFEGNLSFSESGEYAVFNIDSRDKKHEHHKVLVFDRDFNLLWDKEFKLPYKDKNFDLEQVKVANSGDVYILGKVKLKKKKKKKGGKYHYELFKLNKNKQESLNLSVEEHFVASLRLNFAPNNDIHCIGFYSDKKENLFKGVSSFLINSTDLSLKQKNFSPFTEQFMVDKYGKKKNKELRNIVFKNISYTDDGDILIAAEEFFITVTYVQNQYGGYQRVSYNFDDIMMVKLDKQGKLLWARNINKAQTSSYFSDPLMSYGTAKYQKNNYLLLNAHKNMGELSGGRIKFRESFLWKATKRNTNLYLVKFEPNGEFSYKTVLANKDEVASFNCRYIEQISDNELILYGQRKKKRQFLKITFN